MTFNLSVLTPDFAICATDRRLTTPAGKIVTERSNKLTLIDFADGHGFITYTGIGWDFRKRTPSDWIADIPYLGRLSIDDAAAAIKADAERRLAEIARRGFDVRHSFVMGGFKLGAPFALLISNYDSFDGPERPDADSNLLISGKEMNLSREAAHPYLVLATGAKPRHPARIKLRLLPAIKNGTSSQELRKLVVKTVKDIAYQDDRKASVGSSVQSVVIDRSGGCDIRGHVPGGTTLLESPNIIGGAMKVADFYIDVSGEPKWRYDPALGKARISEAVCGNCGSPVPEGYRLCGVCDAPSSQWDAGPG
ncbi:MAG: hypothetical protein JWL96_313 [Sphingomonas bacterium]|uniref:hypothetical protein n=1 Tax=Sphingomonas bacterium TaxID=1895847 RepID=UPI002608F5DA|nr:hypothetical protein [Sphingomonas bacterium]MDB5708243.1 hypothetical protein [Sphingomonas bacterium]